MLTLQNHQQGRIKLMREIFSGYYYYSQRDIIYSMYSVLYSMCLAGKLPIIPGTAASNTKNGIVCKLNGACSRHRAAMVQDGSNCGNTDIYFDLIPLCSGAGGVGRLYFPISIIVNNVYGGQRLNYKYCSEIIAWDSKMA